MDACGRVRTPPGTARLHLGGRSFGCACDAPAASLRTHYEEARESKIGGGGGRLEVSYDAAMQRDSAEVTLELRSKELYRDSWSNSCRKIEQWFTKTAWMNTRRRPAEGARGVRKTGNTISSAGSR